jgi:hypothetical protein
MVFLIMQILKVALLTLMIILYRIQLRPANLQACNTHFDIARAITWHKEYQAIVFLIIQISKRALLALVIILYRIMLEPASLYACNMHFDSASLEIQ